MKLNLNMQKLIVLLKTEITEISCVHSVNIDMNINRHGFIYLDWFILIVVGVLIRIFLVVYVFNLFCIPVTA